MRQPWISGGCDWRVIVGLSEDVHDAIRGYMSVWEDVEEVSSALEQDTKSYKEISEELGQRASELQDLKPFLFAHLSTKEINRVCTELLEVGVSGLSKDTDDGLKHLETSSDA